MRYILLLITLLTTTPAFSGEWSLTGALGAAAHIRTIEDGTWIQEGLSNRTQMLTPAWRAGVDYRFLEQWSVQANYINLGTVAIDTAAVSDEDYDPKGHRCLRNCVASPNFHTHDLKEGAELSVSRHWSLGPVDPFLRVGGAAMYHRLTAQFGATTLLGLDGHPFNGWIPTALVGGGSCYGWVCADVTYYRGMGGGTDWSAGLPISKSSVVTMLAVKIPLSGW